MESWDRESDQVCFVADHWAAENCALHFTVEVSATGNSWLAAYRLHTLMRDIPGAADIVPPFLEA